MKPTKTTTKTPTFDFQLSDGENRLGELILHISRRCQTSPTFGATKLNKILWCADFLAFAETGRPITGVQYMRIPNGPVPRRLLPVRSKLEAAGSLAVETVMLRSGYPQKRTVALRKADLSAFTAEQIEIVDRVIVALSEKNAKGVSRMSHGKAWEAAGGDQELIPYEAAFLSDEKNTLEDKMRTKELARKFGWPRLERVAA